MKRLICSGKFIAQMPPFTEKKMKEKGKDNICEFQRFPREKRDSA